VKQLAKEVDMVLVIGSRNSENSNQLRKVAEAQGVNAYLVDDYHLVDYKALVGVRRIGITSGASVPEHLVQEAVDFFKSQGAQVTSLGFTEENIHFSLPKEVRNSA
jgi:4-hydroxy-3-methylbut-2-enyl diphosphate reductase